LDLEHFEQAARIVPRQEYHLFSEETRHDDG